MDINTLSRERLLEYGTYINSKFFGLDGLKTVQRRILYVVYKLARKKYVKSAMVVGETIGKYHPHGDQSVYNSLVGLVRKKYIIGKGNFGTNNTIEEIPPAAYRYTEVTSNENKFFVDMYDLIPYTYFIENDLGNKEPVLMPSLLPINMIRFTKHQNVDSVIGLGATSSLPLYKYNDLLDYIKYLLDAFGEHLNKIEQYEHIFNLTKLVKNLNYQLKPSLSDYIEEIVCDNYNNSKISLDITYKLDIKDNKIILYNIPSGKFFEKIEDIDSKVKVLDLSSDDKTEIHIIPSKRSFRKVLEFCKKHIKQKVTIHNSVAVLSPKVINEGEGKIPVVYMSPLLHIFLQLAYYVLVNKNKYKHKLNHLKQKQRELELISILKQPEVLKANEPEQIRKKLNIKDYTNDEINEILKKYSIYNLVKIKTDIRQIKHDIDNTRNILDDIVSFVYNNVPMLS